jgi:hypothetical protein
MSIIALLHNLLKEKPWHSCYSTHSTDGCSRGWVERSVGIHYATRTGAFRTCLHQTQN